MKSIIYWSPHLSKVATIGNVIKSAAAIRKYSKEYEPVIIDACNEWNNYANEIKKHNIKILKLSNLNFSKLFPVEGFFKSRFYQFIIFIYNFFPLLKFIKKRSPDFLVIHLCTSLPLILFYLFNFKTRLILRISGLPKKNYIRLFLWKLVEKKIFFITCPSEETRSWLISSGIFKENKLVILHDPILNVNQITKKLKDKYEILEQDDLKFYLSIGRLTRQKNHILLIKMIKSLVDQKIDIKIIILGDGEKFDELNNLILKYKLKNNIILLGYVKNVFPYLEKCEAVIIPSLWEDPGAVMIEAAYMKKLIISSDCPSGPKEFIQNGLRGYLFENNKLNSLTNVFVNYLNDPESKKLNKIKEAQMKSKLYTTFNHYKELEEILRK